MVERNCAISTLVAAICLLALMTCRLAVGAHEPDRIATLPGLQPEVTFNQYSGYLDGQSDNIQLHYWLVEAKENAAGSPLLLWLNGGPGCSSLDGLLNENGPFMVGSDGLLSFRQYTWNDLANVLYLETPAGTGFSYAKDGVIDTSDDKSGDDNYQALKNFLTKFPEYNDRDLYIAGQSFAGVYIPMLAKRLVENPIGINLRGIAIGNGLTNNKLNDNSIFYYARYHGIIDLKMWMDLMRECCQNQSPLNCMFTNNAKEEKCRNMLIQIRTKQALGLDYYNIFRPCDGGVNKPGMHEAPQLWSHFDESAFVEWHQMPAHINFYDKSETCMNYDVLETYLNRDDVKTALHITKSDITWKVCNELQSQYTRQYKDQKEFILQILKENVNVLIYNGDVDAICNVVGGDWFAESLELEQIGPYSKWLYNNENDEAQVGGWRKTYISGANKVIFATVRGSGHMVPRDTPAAAYHMIKSFMETATLD